MKKLILVLIVILSSCNLMEQEKAYNLKRWEYKTKDLEIEYLEKVTRLKEGLELRLYIATLDSVYNYEINKSK